MINPSIETDLVGDIIEVIELHWVDYSGDSRPIISKRERRVVARGRCRAITTDGQTMNLWLEVFDDACKYCWRDDEPQIGDVIVVGTENSQSGYGQRILKLIKDYSK